MPSSNQKGLGEEDRSSDQYGLWHGGTAMLVLRGPEPAAPGLWPCLGRLATAHSLLMI